MRRFNWTKWLVRSGIALFWIVVLSFAFGSMLPDIWSAIFGKSKNVVNGPLVIGTIAATKQTQVYVAGRPQVAFLIWFYTQDGKLITATDKEVMDQSQLAQYQPGNWTPIRYDTANPQHITIVFDADSTLVNKALDQYRLATGQLNKEELNIKEHGIQSKGILMSAQPTGRIVNDDETEMVLHVKVTRPDGTTFNVTQTAGVAQHDIKYALPGSMVYVDYLPNDEQNIFIEWNN